MSAPYIPGHGIPIAIPSGSESDPMFSQVRAEVARTGGTNTPHPSAAENDGRRLSRKRVAWLDEHLPERDRAVLELVAAHRYLTTGQLERFVFTTHSSAESAARTARRVLTRLERTGLLASLDRRIGGVRAGSSARVWQLTSGSARLLRDDGLAFRRHDPSPRFLSHCLAVGDVNLGFRALTGHGANDVTVDVEPVSWRSFTGPGGERRSLKPDLAVLIQTDDFDERWFVEVDLGTESLPTLLRKCGQYESYRESGTEQAEHGSFPLVWWVLTSAQRAERLISTLRRTPRMTPGLYRIATFETLPAALTEAVQ